MHSLNTPGMLKGSWDYLDEGNPAIVYKNENYQTISQIIGECVAAEQDIPLSIAVHWSINVIETLEQLKATANQVGKYEIDISIWPDTVIVDPAGKLYITHFSLNTPPSISSSIVKRELNRYFIYTAPEQIIPGHTPDDKVLYFVLGMLLFELFTSKPLFSSHASVDPTRVTRRKLRNLHPVLSDVNPRLKSLDPMVDALLKPNPNDRLADLAEIKDEIMLFEGNLGMFDNQSETTSFQCFRKKLTEQLREKPLPVRMLETTNINQFNSS